MFSVRFKSPRNHILIDPSNLHRKNQHEPSISENFKRFLYFNRIINEKLKFRPKYISVIFIRLRPEGRP